MIAHTHVIKKPIASSFGQPAMMAIILLSTDSEDYISNHAALRGRMED